MKIIPTIRKKKATDRNLEIVFPADFNKDRMKTVMNKILADLQDQYRFYKAQEDAVDQMNHLAEKALQKMQGDFTRLKDELNNVKANVETLADQLTKEQLFELLVIYILFILLQHTLKFLIINLT